MGVYPWEEPPLVVDPAFSRLYVDYMNIFDMLLVLGLAFIVLGLLSIWLLPVLTYQLFIFTSIYYALLFALIFTSVWPGLWMTIIGANSIRLEYRRQKDKKRIGVMGV